MTVLHDFKSYLSLLFRQWWFTGIAIFSGISTISTFVPSFYAHFAIPRWVPLAVLLASFLAASFKVYLSESQAHVSAVGTLRDEMAALKVRLYDEHKRATAERMLQGYSDRQRDLLRFVLTHGRPNQSVLNQGTRLSPEEQRRDLQPLERDGLILRDESQSGLRGIITFWVAEDWTEVFQDLLFPRRENSEPFYG